MAENNNTLALKSVGDDVSLINSAVQQALIYAKKSFYTPPKEPNILKEKDMDVTAEIITGVGKSRKKYLEGKEALLPDKKDPSYDSVAAGIALVQYDKDHGINLPDHLKGIITTKMDGLLAICKDKRENGVAKEKEPDSHGRFKHIEAEIKRHKQTLNGASLGETLKDLTPVPAPHVNATPAPAPHKEQPVPPR